MYYKGDLPEKNFFGYLNQDSGTAEVRTFVNPIRDEENGSLEKFLTESEEFLDKLEGQLSRLEERNRVRPKVYRI